MKNPKEWVIKAKGKRPNRVWIHNENYGHGCYILWPVDSATFKREYLHANPESEFKADEDFHISGARFISSQGKMCIGFSANRPAPGMIAHEVTHLCNELFDTIGIRPDYSNDEAQGYYVQWAVDKIYNLTRGIK